MEEVRLVFLATLIAAVGAGSLYAGVRFEQDLAGGEPVTLAWGAADHLVQPGVVASPRATSAGLPAGAEMPSNDELDRLDDLEWREWLGSADVTTANAEELALGEGIRLGPLEIVDPDAVAPRPRRRAHPRRPPMPRLHSDPGMHSILVARHMIASGERIQGSCYLYLSEVYARAGHSSWRKRRIVHRGERDGPYADLDLIRPGDWLYIVTDPHRSPVGTHSVMFLGWEDRARGYARTISHAGWGVPRVGRVSGYDVSKTYRIVRPTL